MFSVMRTLTNNIIVARLNGFNNGMLLRAGLNANVHHIANCNGIGGSKSLNFEHPFYTGSIKPSIICFYLVPATG